MRVKLGSQVASGSSSSRSIDMRLPAICLHALHSTCVHGYGRVTRWGLFLMRGVHTIFGSAGWVAAHAYAVSKQPDSLQRASGRSYDDQSNRVKH